ncbi:MAG TPA: dihydropteroate synthase [Edaphobacter sp.]
MPFVSRPLFDWQLRTQRLALGRRTLVMGILNVTPDSFSDGGLFFNAKDAPERALEHAMTMLDQRADLLDLGGESTRPGSARITPDEEQARVLPVLTAILRERASAVVSIDTFHASTARYAVEAGAEIVNDVSGHLWDEAMSSTCADLGCGAVLMHARGTPAEWRSLPALEPDEVMPMIVHELESRVGAATAAGIARDHLVLDPGIGFGKRLEENYPILTHLEEMHRLKLPVLVGVSRKSFLTRALRIQDDRSRLNATLAANTAAVLAGAHIVRVHDVQAAVEAAAVADRILRDPSR